MVFSNTTITGKEAQRCDHITTDGSSNSRVFCVVNFLQDGNLPFTNVLSEGIIAQRRLLGRGTGAVRVWKGEGGAGMERPRAQLR
jgi:hypothetical protein